MDVGQLKVFSAEECLMIVRNALATNDVELKSYAVTRGSNELVGFMGEYYKLTVQLKDARKSNGVNELHYFVKSVPMSNEFHKNECERKGFFPKETRIYAEILPNIQRYAPSKLFASCYYTRSDVIVLEDLSVNYCQSNRNEFYTLEHQHLLLDHLAKLHAASVAWERAEHVNIGERFKDVLVELHLSMSNEWYVAGAKGVMYLAKRHPRLRSPELVQFIENRLFYVLSHCEIFTETTTRTKNVLCHRDTWDRNIFYKYNDHHIPVECLIVDFQLSKYSSPTVDLNFFLHVSTTKERRTEIYDQCVDFYFNRLHKHFKDLGIPAELMPRDGFMEDNRRSRLVALILWAICEPLMKMPEGLSNKMRAEEKERFDYYMNTERDELFDRVIALDTTNTYEATIMSPIEELVLYIYNNPDLTENL